MFWILGWIVFGFLVGLIARALIPGEQAMGCMRTILLGIAGSFVGGAIGYLLQGGSLIQSSGWIGSVVGAVILLALSARRGKFID
ncbi:GlsB/YeaQ/YmgE family stress response membrane protein [Rubripirellula amarantea]|nr:GlsB/YeaQ/YmgE family stress response membrane protein [Rubripirellula amarantea]MDA8744333.1 GlsB/YeaQ/YmgE family stress response membrane protein [Rubripirellula amarantea]